MKLLKLLIFILVLLLLLAGGLAKYYADNRDFTPWMTMKEMDAFLKPLEAKDANGKDGWNRRWVTDIQSRWHDGYSQLRIRIGNAPATGPYWWYWWLNQDAKLINGHLDDMINQNFQLVSFTTLRLPDGSERFCGVWHRTGPQ